MELRHLRYFRAVAQELHFGRAAALLHVAQPPLSQQIRQLERELGVELLQRTTRSVDLTPAGRAYLRHVAAILDAVDDAGTQARRIAEGTEGHLSIGCVGSATYSLLPALVRALGEALPDVEVSVRGEMLAPDQLAALTTREIDLALLRPPARADGVIIQTLRRDPLLAVLPDGHALTDRAAVRVKDLDGEPFVAYPGRGRSVMNAVVTSLCAEAGFVPRIRHEAIETSTLVSLVAAGLGVAIVPAPTAALNIAGIQYRPMEPKTLGIDLVAARLKSNETPLMGNVISVLHRIADGPQFTSGPG